MRVELPQFQVGHHLSAAEMNTIVQAVALALRSSLGPNSVGFSGAGGTVSDSLPSAPILLMRTTGGITGRSGSTPGSGTAVPYAFNGTTLSTLSQSYTVRNWWPNATGTNKDLICSQLWGTWWALGWPCD